MKIILCLALSLSVTPVWADDLLNVLDSPGATAETPNQGYKVRNLFPSATAEQNIFFSFFEAGEYEKALYQWFSAFDRSSTAKTDNGRAIFGLLLYKNGLKVFGLQELFSADANGIAGTLKKAWAESAVATDPTWKVSRVKWTSEFTAVFGPQVESIVRASQVDAATPLATLQGLADKAPDRSEEKAWLKWQVALAHSLKGETAQGAKIIKELLATKEKRVSNDQLNLTVGRLLYEKGFLDAAIEYYQKVGKNSSDWFEAREEIAWAHLRKGEPQNALAVLQDLQPTAFASQVGPEPIFLKSLAHLKVCDYPNVATTLKDFKTRFKPRAEALKALIDAETSIPSDEFIAKVKKGEATLKDLGPLADRLPRGLHREEVLRKLVLFQAQLESEAQKADALYARSLTGGTEKVGFNARFGEFKLDLAKKAQGARGASLSRIRQLATNEFEEITQILQRAHIVEAEMVQQIHLSKKVTENSLSKVDVKKGRAAVTGEVLSFPFDGEVWMDELSNYKVDVKKGCQARKGAG